MRNCIYTIAINRKDDIFDICIESIKQYAEKIGVDFILRQSIQDHVIDNEFDYKNIIMEKFFISDLLKVYDRVLYIDADILIKKDSPDIFEEYKDDRFMYLYNEISYNDVNYDKQIEKAKIDNNINWTKKGEHYNFYNAGVMLVSKYHQGVFVYNKEDYFIFPDMPMIVDEPYIHKKIFDLYIDVKELDKKYNTMIYFDDNGDFLHFANVLDRNERIKQYV